MRFLRSLLTALLGGEQYGETGCARRAFERNSSAMLVDEVLGEREPQTGATIAAGHQGVKDALPQFFGYAGSVVEDFNGDHVSVPPTRQRHLAHNAGAQHDFTMPADTRPPGVVHDRLRSVADDIEHRLDQLLLVTVYKRKTDVVVASDFDAARKLRHDQAAYPLQNFVHIERRGPREPVRSEHPVHQRLKPVGLLHDYLGVLMQTRALQLMIEQLCGTADSTQRILDFVGEITDELPIGLGKGQHAFLASDLDLLLDMAEFEQHHLPRQFFVR